ncbi:MAG: Hsp20/alpha crystallin family protein [Planctomycetaceae bacterium]|nr:Hsp20/alpha crystallin family protein [Planctomycetaceae bacterium]
MTTQLKRQNGPTTLANWFQGDPFRSMREEFDTMMSRLTQDWNGDLPLEKRMRFPALNLTESDDHLELTMDLPGVSADEVDIELQGNTLRISGEHKEEKEETGKRYHRVERQSGSFYRSIELPCEVDQDKINAECKHGVLEVTLPKVAAAVSKKVKVKG